MFYRNCYQRLSKAGSKRLPAFYFTRRHVVEAVIFGGVAILISGGAITPALFSNWQQQPDSFTPTDDTTALLIRAVVVDPKTSAIRLEPIPSDPQAHLP